MFVVLVGSVLTTLVARCATSRSGAAASGFTLQIALWLWFTVLFANFAEAMAEGRGKAQADTLRKSRTQTHGEAARRVDADDQSTLAYESSRARRCARAISCSARRATSFPATARSSKASRRWTSRRSPASPRRSFANRGGDRSAVTGGTKVLSDYLVIRITANPGETFLDRMIALVEGASRQKTPNEIALTILLSGLTIIFLFAVVTLQPFAIYSGGAGDDSGARSRCSSASSRRRSAACSRPSASPGMDRMIQQNVIAMSGRAVEAAGDVNTLLLDKTGTITLGNRQAVEFIPVAGVDGRAARRSRAARVAARRDARRAQHRRAREGAVRPARPHAAEGSDDAAAQRDIDVRSVLARPRG